MKVKRMGFVFIAYIALVSCSSSALEDRGEVEATAPIVQPTSIEPTRALPLPAPTDSQSFTFIPLIANLPTQTAIPTFTPVPSATLPAVEGASCIPNNEREHGVVTRVIDGDTIEVQLGDKRSRVRYIGMDTPENTSQVENFGPQAASYNQSLVGGKNVELIKDVSETDQYSRLLRYVITGGVFVNYQLVRQGYASAATFPPDVSCSATFVEAERLARAGGLGLWIPVRPPKAVEAPPPGDNCDASYPDFCIPPSPPDLDCGDIPYKRFKVLPPDPHRFDGDHDGIGCER